MLLAHILEAGWLAESSLHASVVLLAFVSPLAYPTNSPPFSLHAGGNSMGSGDSYLWSQFDILQLSPSAWMDS